MDPAIKAVAFIGLGVMGYPMAVNLRKGLERHTILYVYDVNAEACEKLQQEAQGVGSVTIVNSGAEAARAADIVFTVMPSDEAVRQLYFDSTDGILVGVKSATNRKILVECGTIARTTILEVFDAAHKLPNVTFVDAPISGGPLGSQAGTLTIMVGSTQELFAKLKPLLCHMGKPESIFHCGDIGAGTAFKTINNYISLISVLSTCEGYNIACRMGFDLNKLTGVLKTGSAQNWVISKNNPVPGITPGNAASNNYIGGFRLELAIKDLTLGVGLADSAHAHANLGSHALNIFKDASNDERYAGKDARVLYKYLQEK